MYNQELTDIKNAILQYNTYFDKGFTGVYQDERKGIVHNENVIFPMDTLGNYFYLRLPSVVRFTTRPQDKISDCLYGMSVNAPIILVAVVKDADPDKLVKNLLYTLATMNVSIQSAVFDSASVVLQELSRVSSSVQDAALARISNHTIVSIAFTLDSVFIPQKLNCITNPCKEC